MAKQTLLSRTEASIKQMTWLTESDDAAKKLALEYAKLLDAAIDGFERNELTVTEFHKMLRLGPDLLAALAALGGTPAARKAMQAEVAGKVSSTDELRAKRAARAASRA